MSLEATQMLCTVCNQHGHTTPYASAYVNHPVTKWVGESLSNWLWTRELVLSLGTEWIFRFNTVGKCVSVASLLTAPDLPDLGETSRPLAMPTECQVPSDKLLSYRRYYYWFKWSLGKWTKRGKPAWYNKQDMSLEGDDFADQYIDSWV
jgi:hypothetical protein